MAKVCEICGGDHRLDESLLATCSKCNSTCEHVYCMREVKREVPEDWVCGSCLTGIDLILKESGMKDAHVTSSLHENEAVTRAMGNEQFSASQLHSKRQKPVQTGKVKFISHEEAIKLSSGTAETKCNSSRRKSTFQRPTHKFRTMNPKAFSDRVKSSPCKPHKLTGPFRNPTLTSSTVNQQMSRTFKESKASELSPVASGKLHANQKQSMDDISVPKNRCVIFENKMENSTKTSPSCSRPVDPEKKAAASCNKDPLTKQQPAQTFIPPRKVENSNKKISKELLKESCTLLPSLLGVNTGGKTKDIAQHDHSNVQEGDLQNFPRSYALYLTYFPAQDVIWEGGFKILNWNPCEVFGRFQAQLPCKIHRKVNEISRKMPPVLEVNLLPQHRFLVDLFQDECPDLLDVAMYLFPAENIERSRQNFLKLVEHMEIHESIMRCYIDDVELLIFTSSQLNVDSQNVLSSKSKQFLWGIFRSTNDKPFLSDAQEELSSFLADEDMEIDMVGGISIGRVDVIVPRKHLEVTKEELTKYYNQEHILSPPPGFTKKFKSEPTV
ncbi:PHD finger-containing protein 1 isoform X2 [Cannabis sativa]|uniref:PHD finger-containing protein 1 isoform X2 n=1 Tax=Cannabis sativa TaxID=3483 RepID=UPI0029C9FE42|nr:PHD finger-containing protein 1 isoform X2 [Cannabis sativa]